MNKDKFRKKQEEEFFSDGKHSKDNPLDVEAFEQKFAKEKNKKSIFKLKVAAVIFSVLLSAAGTFFGTRVYNKLNFKEPVYNEEMIHTPDFYNDHPIEVYIEKNDFTKSQFDSIKNVFETIDERCPGLKFSFLEKNENWNIYLHAGKIEQNSDMTILGQTLGYLGSFSQIIIDEEFAKSNSNSFDSVITHEVLHALGLGHTKDFTNIMFPYNLNREISEKEFEILNKLYPTTQNVNHIATNTINEADFGK